MRRHLPRWFTCLALAGTLLGAGCSDGPSQPPDRIFTPITGSVVDAAGRPQAGVAIGLIYELIPPTGLGSAPVDPVHPLAKPASMVRYVVPVAGPVRLWLTDRAGDLVVTLVEETLPAGTHTVLWDGADSTGKAVPSGSYRFHVQIGEDPPQSMDLFMLYIDPVDFLSAPNAVTDAEGRFRIPADLVAVGDPLIISGETGTAFEPGVVGGRLRVVAIRPGDPAPVWTEQVLDFDVRLPVQPLRFVLP